MCTTRTVFFQSIARTAGIDRMSLSFWCVIFDVISMMFVSMNQCINSWMLGELSLRNFSIPNIASPFIVRVSPSIKGDNATSKQNYSQVLDEEDLQLPKMIGIDPTSRPNIRTTGFDVQGRNPFGLNRGRRTLSHPFTETFCHRFRDPFFDINVMVARNDEELGLVQKRL